MTPEQAEKGSVLCMEIVEIEKFLEGVTDKEIMIEYCNDKGVRYGCSLAYDDLMPLLEKVLDVKRSELEEL